MCISTITKGTVFDEPGIILLYIGATTATSNNTIRMRAQVHTRECEKGGRSALYKFGRGKMKTTGKKKTFVEAKNARRRCGGDARERKGFLARMLKI